MEQNAEHAWEIIAKLEVCTLVSKGDDGFSGRPMTAIIRQKGDRIYFLSVSTSPQVADISAHPDVLLAFGDGKTFLCAEGEAEIFNDRALIAELWNVGAQAFWPEGPEAAPVSVIAVTPKKGEYWEGYNAAVSTVKFAFALATGSKAEMGSNENFKLQN